MDLTPTTANLGIGTSATINTKLSLSFNSTSAAQAQGLSLYTNNTSTGSAFGARLTTSASSSNGTGTVFGLYSVNENYGSTGTVYGLYSSSYAYNSSNSGNVYGLRSYGSNASTTGSVYGIYSSVSGGANDKRWAGYFAGGNVVVTAGNVGIGTTNPSANLDVIGTTQTEKLLIKKPTIISNWNSLWQSGFYDSDNAANAPESSGWFWGINMNHTSNDPNYQYGGQIAIRNSPGDPTMYFRSTNVDGEGIWAKVLHSAGDQTIVGSLSVERNTTEGGCIDIRNSSKTQNGTASSWKIMNMAEPYGNSLQFWAYDNVGCGNSGALCAPRFVLMDNGNVGIGTLPLPAVKLDVDGNIKTVELQANNILWNGNDAFINHNGNSFGHYSLGWYGDSWTTQGPTLLCSSFGGMKFFSGGFPRFSITAEGNIGIGRSDPFYKLDVVGTIRAHEVRINSNTGADFVFDENYTLKTLDEVHNFIKTNKHLPEIPSATEMVENGVDMGEFQVKLLQKIEELTLYIIAQDKRIKELEKNAK